MAIRGLYGYLNRSTCLFLIFSDCADLEWKVLYVGSAHDSHQDQVLDEILVGPVPVGLNKFVLQADAPDPAQLPPEEVLGVTVVLVTCSYQSHEFIRVGYYVNNEYTDPVFLANEDPEKQLPVYPNVDMKLVQRHILADKPRVTKFAIPWGKQDAAEQLQLKEDHPSFTTPSTATSSVGSPMVE